MKSNSHSRVIWRVFMWESTRCISSSKSLLYVTFRHKWSFKWHCNTIKRCSQLIRWLMYRWWCEGGGDRTWWVIESVFLRSPGKEFWACLWDLPPDMPRCISRSAVWYGRQQIEGWWVEELLEARSLSKQLTIHLELHQRKTNQLKCIAMKELALRPRL